MRPLRAAFLGLFVLAGCAAAPSASEYVAASSRMSAEADAAADRDDPGAAAVALEGLLALEVPPAMSEDDARLVRQDAHDRLARMRLLNGDLEAARASADAGLALGEHDDLFTASLLTTRGRVLEAEGRDREAARDYHRALTIHESLLDQALGGD